VNPQGWLFGSAGNTYLVEKMPLSPSQKEILRRAIRDYSFPPELYDFILDRPDPQPDTRAVEAKIKADLICGDPKRVKNGLSNVLYWGFARMAIRDTRVGVFRNNVTDDGLDRAAKLFCTSISPPLTAIGKLELPQFSGVSFVSKIRMFLNPETSATLDRQIMKIHRARRATVLAKVRVYPTQIPVNSQNAEAYELWCRRMVEISTSYFGGNFRAADVERGFFQLVQNDEVSLAGEILENA